MMGLSFLSIVAMPLLIPFLPPLALHLLTDSEIPPPEVMPVDPKPAEVGFAVVVLETAKR